jgi:hypothetical protein
MPTARKLLPPILWTMGRYAAEHNIARQTVSARKTHPAFPAPIAYALEKGNRRKPLYLEADLRAFDEVYVPMKRHDTYEAVRDGS